MKIAFLITTPKSGERERQPDYRKPVHARFEEPSFSRNPGARNCVSMP